MGKPTPEYYNQKQMNAGKFTMEHITLLVRAYQRGHGLRVDGKAGPITVGTLEETPSPLALAIVDVARGEIGKGEGDGWNNSGPDIYKYRRKKYAGKRLYGPWCAYLASWVYSQACEQLGVIDVIGMQGGAKRLGRMIADEGRYVSKHEVLLPGDFVVWDRGQINSPEGHIGIVPERSDDGAFYTIEGNKGPYPSEVTEYSHYIHDNDRIEFIARPL